MGGERPSLVITGHEDGKVKLWLSQRGALALVTALDTARYFATEDCTSDTDSDPGGGDWPPFRRVGCFDPFTDDPRYITTSIQSLYSVKC